ncbi:MAG TPA: hypothetical protein DDY78_16410 [Planctomycetales bacterium]|jgi:uncharacterized protein (DUF433 family)|nr:hypothetical protein [Planctomycetales bacterium]
MDLPDFLTRHEYGNIRLTGHRIDLMHVVDFLKEGCSAQQIQAEFPTLPLDLIRQTASFYQAEREEVDSYVARCHEEMDRAYAAYQPGPGVLKVRRLMEQLRQADAAHAADPTWATLSIGEKLRRVEAEECSKTG